METGNGWTDFQWQTAAAADLTARTAKVLRSAHSREEARDDLHRDGVAAGAVAFSHGARRLESGSRTCWPICQTILVWS